MKTLLVAFLFASAPAFANYDESYNFQPGLNLYNEAAQLKDLFGTHGSELCAPIAITHAFAFLKYYRNPAYGQLATFPDMDGDGKGDTWKDRIRYFFQSCQTDKEEGTKYNNALACMRRYITDSGYKAWAYTVGPHSLESPPDANLNRAITIADVRYFASRGMAILLGIGWYKKDAAGNWVRAGGHFIDIYGYSYDQVWGENRIVLNVVNSWVDYSGRVPAQMFDAVWMTRSVDGLPATTPFELSGTGLIFQGYKAVAEDLFVAVPY